MSTFTTGTRTDGTGDTTRDGGRVASVLVVDDQPIYRDGLRKAVQAHPLLLWSGECDGTDEALRRMSVVRTDVVLIDYSIPRMDAVAAAAATRAAGAQTSVIVLSDVADPRRCQRALAAGAAAFLTKQADDREICECACQAARARRGESPAASDHPAPFPSAVSERELEVLVLMAHGWSATDIALALHISATTVRSHQRRIYDKLDVRSAPAAVFQAVKLGLLEA